MKNSMLNITYAPVDEAMAHQMQRDLMDANVKVKHPVLIVLVSPEIYQDKDVQRSMKQAVKSGFKLMPVMTRQVALPDQMKKAKPFLLDLTAGYDRERFLQHIEYVDIKATRLLNRWNLYLIVVLALLFFVVSMIAIAGDVVGFPQEEYEALDTAVAATNSAQIKPTIDGWLPSSTEDAQNFAPTVEAAPTLLRPFLIMTATALAETESE